MRFTSLIVELIRARPGLLFWLAVLSQASLWFVVPVSVYASPPVDVAMLLAYGHEFQIGSDLGPPLAFWLGEIAFRLAGNHLFGVYALSQLCSIVAFWAIFRLGRQIVGPRHALLAILLTLTVIEFSFPGAAFGPDVLARPLWALLLLHLWQIVGRNQRSAWFALSIDAGLLLLTTDAAILLILLAVGFAVGVSRGRRMLISLDPWFALLVVLVLALPYLVWLGRGGRDLAEITAALNLTNVMASFSWPAVVLWPLLGLLGIAVLYVANSRYWSRNPEEAPIILRQPVDPLARGFVLFFALAPFPVMALAALVLGLPHILGGAGALLLMSGLAAILVSGDVIYLRRQRTLRSVWLLLIMLPVAGLLGQKIVQPWTRGPELQTSLPASEIGQFFGDSFKRRVGRQLPAVTGDPAIATIVAFAAPGRPHLLLDAAPSRTPWIDQASLLEKGAIVVWRAQDTGGAPPADLASRFPNLVPEVPRNFSRQIKGRQVPLLIGWAIIRPRTN